MSPHLSIEYPLKEYQVNCELIAFDAQPFSDVFGNPVEFLGIDIVYDDGESLFEDLEYCDGDTKEKLNRYHLCDNMPEAIEAINRNNADNIKWEARFVYRVNI